MSFPPHPPPTPPSHAVSEKNHRILVVDDNEAIHNDFRKILGLDSAEAEFDAEEAEIFGEVVNASPRFVFEMSFASQGAEAFDLVKASREQGHRFALVFMDVRMPPGWDGLETALRLWEIDPDLQIVICTAYSDKSWEEMIEKLGNPERVLILKKPFDTVEVLQMAHALTEKWTLLQSSRQNLESLERTVQARTRELQAANDGLQASEQRFRKLSASAPIGIFETDARGTILYSNPKWQRISGIRPQDGSGDAWQRMIHPDDSDATLTTWRSAIQSGTDFDREFRYRKMSGEDLWVQMRATPIRSQAGEVTGYVGSVEDVTERKAIELELARARDAAVESANLKSRFLANMSHEIRTPLNGIIGMTDLLLESSLTEEQRNYLTMAQTSGTALLGLINDILDLSKLEAGKLTFENIEFGLRETIQRMLKPLVLRANQKNLELRADIAADVPERLLGDPMRLRQILLNFTDNALKFTDQGSIVIKVAPEKEGDLKQCLHFSVTDTGIGIPPEKQKVIFEAFAQVDDSTTRNYGGTGLGLAIVFQLVEQMHGKVWAESTIGAGTTFHFTAWFGLPTASHASPALPEVANSGHPEPSSANLEEPGTGMRILLADDNAVNRTVASGMLVKRGHILTLAINGREAVERAAVEEFDVIFMDVQMPEIDGFEATSRIRAADRMARRHTPIVAMTAHAMTGDRERCLAAGMDEYIPKPLRTADLLAVLDRVRTISRRRVAEFIDDPKEDAADRLSARPPVRPLSIFTRDELLEDIGGDEEILQEMITAYRESTPRLIEEVRGAIARRESGNLARSAHAFVSTMGPFGAKDACRLARELESHAKNNAFNEAERSFSALVIEATQISNALSAFAAAQS